MGADLGSEHHPDHHDRDTTATSRLRPAPSHPEPEDDTPENASKSNSDPPTWWYDQHAKRGKHRRYIGHIKRVGGTEGEWIRRELAARIYDLLTWAKQQADTELAESDQDGANDDHSE